VVRNSLPTSVCALRVLYHSPAKGVREEDQLKFTGFHPALTIVWLYLNDTCDSQRIKTKFYWELIGSISGLSILH